MSDPFVSLVAALHAYLDGNGDPDTLRDTVEMVIAEHEGPDDDE